MKFPFVLACFGLLMPPVMISAQEFTLAGHSVRVSLTRNDGARQEWPREDENSKSQLSTIPVVVKQGDTIHSLLVANGIKPDVEAFALVYELDPKLESLKDLRKDTPLVLPKIMAGPKLQIELQAGYLAALTLDPKLKELFGQNVKALTALLSRVPASSQIRVADSVSKDTTLASLRNVVETLEFIRLRLIRRNGLPLSLETLEQLNDEAELLRSTLEPVVSAQQELTLDASRQIAAIQRDIDIKTARFVQVAAGAAPDAWPKVKVVVQTLRQGQPVPNLRVVYVPEALKGKPEKARPFDRLSSPCSRQMPEADYVLWAVTDGTGARVSNELLLTVRKMAEEIAVDLTVLP